MATAPPDVDPVLDLDALEPVRRMVRIKTAEHPDGKLYEMREPAELSVGEWARLEKLGHDAERWQKKIDDGRPLSDADVKRIDAITREQARMALVDADQAVEALNTEQRTQVITTFWRVPAPSLGGGDADGAEAADDPSNSES